MVGRVRPEPGKTLAHINSPAMANTRASLWEDNGAIIVFDAATLQGNQTLADE